MGISQSIEVRLGGDFARRNLWAILLMRWNRGLEAEVGLQLVRRGFGAVAADDDEGTHFMTDRALAFFLELRARVGQRVGQLHEALVEFNIRGCGLDGPGGVKNAVVRQKVVGGVEDVPVLTAGGQVVAADETTGE